MYDSVNFLITREGHVGTHINTDIAMALKQQIDLSIQRRRNANDLLAGLELFLEKNRVGSANMFQIIRFWVKKE